MLDKSKTPKRVTIRTVAADAGVSVSAVSKVLRNAYGVSDRLRQQVNASVAKLGYRPSIAARGMRGSSYTIGVLMSDARNSFYADLLEGINAALHSTQFQPLIGVNQHETDIAANLFDVMVDRRVDGIIMIGGPHLRSVTGAEQVPDPKKLREVAARVPMVIIGYYDNSSLFDTVNNDDVLGGRLAVDHLAAQGYRRITFVSPERPGAPRISVAQRRYQGYLAAMDANRLGRHKSSALAREVHHSIHGSMQALFSARTRPEALFCWCDTIAFEVMSAVLAMGYSIPHDIGIVGYDNTRACDYLQNSLSSVDQGGQALGLQAARLLLERIGGRTVSEHFVLPPRLVIRGSSLRSQKS